MNSGIAKSAVVKTDVAKNIGVLGAGQLGRMLALAGYPLGNRFTFLDTTGHPSAGIGEVIVDPDNQHLAEFLAKVDVVTYEFEHLPVHWCVKLNNTNRSIPAAAPLKCARTGSRRRRCLIV
ncbi:hypothetical protein [Halomonas sp. SBBP1]|uniref:hypothetical protein n=1 Tax=Halomonas sp. SBBP1 TaxID=2599306 RepID=UPI0039A4AD06